jgi:hypothetical protein
LGTIHFGLPSEIEDAQFCGLHALSSNAKFVAAYLVFA